MIDAVIPADVVADWFDQYGVADLAYRERDGHGFSGYHLPDYEQQGYDRTLIMENLTGDAWEETALDDGYFRYRHQDFPDCPIEIDDDECWIYLPELKDTQEQELKATLAGGPPGTRNGQRSPATFSVAIMELAEIYRWALSADG